MLQRLTPFVPGPVRFAREDGCAYLVQPFVPGVTLQHRLAQGPLSVASSLRVGIDLLSVLQHAHDQGILHRDVKPANVIVDEQEPVAQAVLIDFGFARSASLGRPPCGTSGSAPSATSRPRRPGCCPRGRRALRPLLGRDRAVRVPRRRAAVRRGRRRRRAAAAPQHARSPPTGAGGRRPPGARRSGPAAPAQGPGRPLPVGGGGAGRPHRHRRRPAAGGGGAGRRGRAARPPPGPDRAVVRRPDRPSWPRWPCSSTGPGEGRGGLVLLEAESGRRARRGCWTSWPSSRSPDAWVLRGQGVEQAARRPFQLLEGLVAGIVAACRARPGLADDLRSAVGDRAEAVVAALPGLAPVLGPAGRSEGGGRPTSAPRPTARPAASRPWPPCSTPWARSGCPAARRPGPGASSTTASGRTARRSAPRRLAGLDRTAGRERTPGSWWWPPSAPRRCRPATPCGPSDPPGRRRPCPGSGPTTCAAWPSRWPARCPRTPCGRSRALSEGSPFMAAAVLRGLVECGALVGTTAGGGRSTARRWPTCRRPARRRCSSPAGSSCWPRPRSSCCRWAPCWARSSTSGWRPSCAGQDPAEAAAGLDEARRRRIVWVDEAGRAGPSPARQAAGGPPRPARPRQRAPTPPAGRRAASRRAVAPGSMARAASGLRAGLPLRRRRRGPARPALRPPGRRAGPVAALPRRRRHPLPDGPGRLRRARPGPGPGAAVAEGLGDVLTLQGPYEEATAHLESALAWPPPTSGGPRSRASWATSPSSGATSGRPGPTSSGPSASSAGACPAGTPALVAALLVEVVVQVAHTLLPRLFVGRRPPGGRRPGVPGHPPLQPAGLRLLVQRGQGPLRLGPPAGDEPGRALPAVARAGPGLLRARPGDDDGALVQPGHRLRPAVARHPPRPGRPLGPGPVAELLRGRPLRRLPLPGVDRPVPGGHPPPRPDGRPVGGQHRRLARRLRPLPAGRAARGRWRWPRTSTPPPAPSATTPPPASA